MNASSHVVPDLRHEVVADRLQLTLEP